MRARSALRNLAGGRPPAARDAIRGLAGFARR